MGQFDRAIETAQRLIKKNGQQVEWIQTADIVPDLTKPWLPQGNTVLTYTPFICFLPFDKEGREFLIAMGASEALSGNYYGLMGAQPFTPSPKDVIKRDGVVLDIASIDLLSPNGQKVLWTITVNG